MVGKLIKHEAIRTRGLGLQIFGAATLLALGGALLAVTGWPVVAQFGLVMGLLATAGLIPAVQLALGIDYWVSSYRRLGYFTQTLPVKGSTIYLAKLLWGLVAIVAAVAWAVVLGLVTFFGNAGAMGLRPFDIFSLVGDFFASVAEVLPAWGWVVFPLLILMFLAFSLVQYFFSASVGSEKRFNSMGIGGPIVVWILIYLAMQLLLMGFMIAVPFGFGLDGDSLGLVSMNFLELMVTDGEAEAVPIGFIPGFLIAFAGLVWRTVVSWDKKVSLA